MVGDHFLWDTFGALGAIRRKAIVTKRLQPYLLRYFEVSAYHQANDLGVCSCIARILNAVIEVLNRLSGLPDYTLIIPDVDIIKNINYFDYGISWILSRCLHWLGRQINKVTTARREYLMKTKPGTLPDTKNPPVIIWVKMPSRPYLQNCSGTLLKSFQQAKKFNNIMKEVCIKIRHRYIEVNGVRKVNSHGYITSIGKVDFWKELDEKFEEIDIAKSN